MKRHLAPDGRLLVLISGPVACGKTTAARTLAEIARRYGLNAASIDLDDIVEMVAGNDWSRIQAKDRALATQVASAIVGELFASHMELVAVAGSTLSNSEWDDLLEPLNPRPKAFYALLRVSPAEAIRRARNDPQRIHTKDPVVIEQLAARIDWSVIRTQHIDLMTDGIDADEVARILAREIFA
jgi:shikimate kinase